MSIVIITGVRTTLRATWDRADFDHLVNNAGYGLNSIAPGAIRTELGGGLTNEFEALLAGQTSLGRVGEPEEVASLIATLLSPEARWVDAQNIEISGGFNI